MDYILVENRSKNMSQEQDSRGCSISGSAGSSPGDICLLNRWSRPNPPTHECLDETIPHSAVWQHCCALFYRSCIADQHHQAVCICHIDRGHIRGWNLSRYQSSYIRYYYRIADRGSRHLDVSAVPGEIPGRLRGECS